MGLTLGIAYQCGGRRRYYVLSNSPQYRGAPAKVGWLELRGDAAGQHGSDVPRCPRACLGIQGKCRHGNSVSAGQPARGWGMASVHRRSGTAMDDGIGPLHLDSANDVSDARGRALKWLLSERGKEGNWFWRWKFKTADREVRFNPDKYGWPWCPGAGSWVIPTAFSVVAIKQFTVCNRSEAPENRIRLGVEMLLERACVAGGWNSGNSIVSGVPLSAHVEATALALLALQDEPRGEIVQASVNWLESRVDEIHAVFSLSWCILTLFVYQRRIDNLKQRLAAIVGDASTIQNNATPATALLALRCGEMVHPLMVLR